MEKKIKTINIRIGLNDYEYLKKYYLWVKDIEPNKHNNFSDYIRYLLFLGIDDYY